MDKPVGSQAQKINGSLASSLCGARRTRDGGSNRRWAVPLGRRFAKRTRRFYAGLNSLAFNQLRARPLVTAGLFFGVQCRIKSEKAMGEAWIARFLKFSKRSGFVKTTARSGAVRLAA